MNGVLLGLLVVSVAVFLRLAISLHPYSGEIKLRAKHCNSYSGVYAYKINPYNLTGYVTVLAIALLSQYKKFLLVERYGCHSNAMCMCVCVQVRASLRCTVTMRPRGTGWRSRSIHPSVNGGCGW